MKAIYLFTALSLSALSFSSCRLDTVGTIFRSISSKEQIKGSGKLVTKAEDFSATPFTALSLPSTLNAEFIPTTGAMRVEIITSDNTQQYAQVTVADGSLIVAWDEKLHIQDNQAVVRVYAPTLGAFRMTGTADCTVTKGFTASNLEVTILGTGDFQALGTVQATTFALKNSGTGDSEFQSLFLKGNADLQSAGTGDNTIQEMQVGDLVINNIGTGDIEVVKLKGANLAVTSSGTGDITLSGEMQKVSTFSLGTGSINIRNLKHK